MKKSAIAIITALIIICLLPTLSVAGESFDAADSAYGYSLLSASARYVYGEFARGVLADTPAKKIELDREIGVTAADVTAGVNAFISDHPEAFWVNGSCSYSLINDAVVEITPTYTYTGSMLTLARQDLEAQVQEIMKKLPTTDNYDKALYLHDALAAHVSYVKEGDHQTAYGALVNQKAVCAGYAAAYQLLLNRAGIRAWTVNGSSINSRTGEVVAHAWTLLWLDDGVCLYTDVTWDDQGDEIYHTYFNRCLEEMAGSHFPETPSALPACGHDGYDIITIRGLKIDLESESALGELIQKLSPASEDTYSATFSCDESKISSWLKQNASDISKALGGEGGYSYTYKNLGEEIHLTFSLKAGQPAPEPDSTPDFTVSGCGLTVGGSVIAIVLTALAAGAVIRKKD